MTIFTAIYNIIIGPLELIFETIFAFAYRLTSNSGISIVVLSLSMNILLLPLYTRADAIQEEENQTQKKLKKWSDHINKTFKGDERYMMMQTYYRQNNYKPSYAIRGLMPLLLEIPFFMAAYNFLSNLQLLKGTSFLFIENLGTPDAMFSIGSFAINILPIVMTVINIVSSSIYTKEAPLKTKIQLYVMALFFLVFLYDSPAGLVLYWTLNNAFSLIKNIITKYDSKRVIIPVTLAVAGVFLATLITFIRPMDRINRQVFVYILSFVFELPLLLKIFNKKENKYNFLDSMLNGIEVDKKLFFTLAITVSLVTGFFIPSMVIKAGPAEFIDPTSLFNPQIYILYSLCLSVGMFTVWAGIFYLLSSDYSKKIFQVLILFIAIAFIVNFTFYGNNLGEINKDLIYYELEDIYYLSKDKLVNSLLMVAIFASSSFIYKKFTKITKSACTILLITILASGMFNVAGNAKEINSALDMYNYTYSKDPVIPLSKNGKNVIVIMLDRAVSAYIPYIFNEFDDLKEIYDGFTLYPNTITYGGHTNVGFLALAGGYEYTPKAIKERSNELLVTKHNEGIKMMPKLFSDNGFDVSFINPIYANYKSFSDLTIFEDIDNVDASITEGRYSVDGVEFSDAHKTLERNLFYYSLMRSAPAIFQGTLYNKSYYNDIDVMEKLDDLTYSYKQRIIGNNKSHGIEKDFVDSLGPLTKLSSFSEIKETGSTFSFITTQITHNPILLQLPNYELKMDVDNSMFYDGVYERVDAEGNYLILNEESKITHYCVNAATYLELGNYLNYLKENNLYDNTKIIIVSDHGWYMGTNEDLYFESDINSDATNYISTLMVKDFNSHGFNVDNTFMTIADVPTIATDGVIENPINPYTNKPINSDAKAGKQYILETEWNVNLNNGYWFEEDQWISVKDNVFDRNNWKFNDSGE